MNMVPLGSLCKVQMGQAPDGTSYNDVGQGVPLLAGATDFGERYPHCRKFTDAPTKVSERGDLLLCIRATIGDLNWSDKPYCLGRGVAALRPRKGYADIGYVAHWIRASQAALNKLGRGSTFKQISRDDITPGLCTE
jgi:type I restriction enzyme S subunit